MERVLIIKEDRGSLVCGLRSIMNILEGYVELAKGSIYKPEKGKSNTKPAEAEHSASFQLEVGKIWGLMKGKDHISDLRRKLGVTITVSSNEIITVSGSKGAVQMCQSILCKDNGYGYIRDSINKANTRMQTHNCMEGPDFKSVASVLSMTNNLGN